MIFIVDDDPVHNLITTQLLNNLQFNEEVVIFNNGKEVLGSIAQGNLPRVILLDINMPIMNGWEFLEVYHNFKNMAEVYILTSSSNHIDLERADEFECIRGYYTKPINKETIKSIFGL
jgi:CheY-like chemotaxis protein